MGLESVRAPPGMLRTCCSPGRTGVFGPCGVARSIQSVSQPPSPAESAAVLPRWAAWATVSPENTPFRQMRQGGVMSRKVRGASSTLLAMMLVLTACSSGPAKTQQPKAVGAGGPEAKASCNDVKFNGGKPTVAYMPPATEFPYYIAIGEGIEAKAPGLGANTFMLAPQSGSDIRSEERRVGKECRSRWSPYH